MDYPRSVIAHMWNDQMAYPWRRADTAEPSTRSTSLARSRSGRPTINAQACGYISIPTECAPVSSKQLTSISTTSRAISSEAVAAGEGTLQT